MDIIVLISIGQIILGLLEISGIKIKPDKYRKTPFDKKNKKGIGIGRMIYGIPWLIIGLIANYFKISKILEYILIIIVSIPALIYQYNHEKYYQ